MRKFQSLKQLGSGFMDEWTGMASSLTIGPRCHAVRERAHLPDQNFGFMYSVYGLQLEDWETFPIRLNGRRTHLKVPKCLVSVSVCLCCSYSGPTALYRSDGLVVAVAVAVVAR